MPLYSCSTIYSYQDERNPNGLVPKETFLLACMSDLCLNRWSLKIVVVPGSQTFVER
jgi:hypothetical protein